MSGRPRAWLWQVPVSLAGREVDEAWLADLPAGADPCGERGESHTGAHAGPIFRQPLSIKTGDGTSRDAICVRRSPALRIDTRAGPSCGRSGRSALCAGAVSSIWGRRLANGPPAAPGQCAPIKACRRLCPFRRCKSSGRGCPAFRYTTRRLCLRPLPARFR